MPRDNRRDVIDLKNPGTYHFTTRCVRRAFLCGKDKRSGKDYSHRKEWIEARVRHLAAWFGIDLMCFAIMSNHLHLIIGTLPQVVEEWSDIRVIRHAIEVFPYKFKEMGVKDGVPTEDQMRSFAADEDLVATMRKRLKDPSWFMRQLKHHVAIKANGEDGVTGHFFEGRFECRRILDTFGFVACALYVDLNEIRAEVATSVAESTHTSAYLRLRAFELRCKNQPGAADLDGFLCPISCNGDGLTDEYIPAGNIGSRRMSDKGRLDLSLEEYFQLLDWTGRQTHPDKRGKIPADAPPVLESVGITSEMLVQSLELFNESYRTAIGFEENIKAHRKQVKQKRLQRTAKKT